MVRAYWLAGANTVPLTRGRLKPAPAAAVGRDLVLGFLDDGPVSGRQVGILIKGRNVLLNLVNGLIDRAEGYGYGSFVVAVKPS